MIKGINKCQFVQIIFRKKTKLGVGGHGCVFLLEHKTCDILAGERLRLMRFDNQLIIDSFQEAICILKW